MLSCKKAFNFIKSFRPSFLQMPVLLRKPESAQFGQAAQALGAAGVITLERMIAKNLTQKDQEHNGKYSQSDIKDIAQEVDAAQFRPGC